MLNETIPFRSKPNDLSTNHHNFVNQETNIHNNASIGGALTIASTGDHTQDLIVSKGQSIRAQSNENAALDKQVVGGKKMSKSKKMSKGKSKKIRKGKSKKMSKSKKMRKSKN